MVQSVAVANRLWNYKKNTMVRDDIDIVYTVHVKWLLNSANA